MSPPNQFAGPVDGSRATVERVAFPAGPLRISGLLVRLPGDGPSPVVVYGRGGNRGEEGGSDGEPEFAAGARHVSMTPGSTRRNGS